MSEVQQITRDPLPPHIKLAVIRRDHRQCRYCGVYPPFRCIEIDHVIPVALGGPTLISNLVTSCRWCNRQKGIKRWKPHPIGEGAAWQRQSKRIISKAAKPKKPRTVNPLYDPSLRTEDAWKLYPEYLAERERSNAPKKNQRIKRASDDLAQKKKAAEKRDKDKQDRLDARLRREIAQHRECS